MSAGAIPVWHTCKQGGLRWLQLCLAFFPDDDDDDDDVFSFSGAVIFWQSSLTDQPCRPHHQEPADGTDVIAMCSSTSRARTLVLAIAVLPQVLISLFISLCASGLGGRADAARTFTHTGSVLFECSC